jgi:hypothetical protein
LVDEALQVVPGDGHVCPVSVENGAGTGGNVCLVVQRHRGAAAQVNVPQVDIVLQEARRPPEQARQGLRRFGGAAQLRLQRPPLGHAVVGDGDGKNVAALPASLEGLQQALLRRQKPPRPTAAPLGEEHHGRVGVGDFGKLSVDRELRPPGAALDVERSGPFEERAHDPHLFKLLRRGNVGHREAEFGAGEEEVRGQKKVEVAPMRGDEHRKGLGRLGVDGPLERVPVDGHPLGHPAHGFADQVGEEADGLVSVGLLEDDGDIEPAVGMLVAGDGEASVVPVQNVAVEALGDGAGVRFRA